MYTGYQAFKDCNFKSDAKQIRHRTSFAEKFIKYTITVRYYIFTDRSYVPTHVSESHMEKFYNYFSEIKDKRFDGLIITGAPVELKRI